MRAAVLLLLLRGGGGDGGPPGLGGGGPPGLGGGGPPGLGGGGAAGLGSSGGTGLPSGGGGPLIGPQLPPLAVQPAPATPFAAGPGLPAAAAQLPAAPPGLPSLPPGGLQAGDVGALISNALASSRADAAATVLVAAPGQGQASAAAGVLVSQAQRGSSEAVAAATATAAAQNAAATATVLAQAAVEAVQRGAQESFGRSQARALSKARGAGRVDAMAATFAQAINEGGASAASAYGVAFAQAAGGASDEQQALAEATAVAFCSGGSTATAFASAYSVALSRNAQPWRGGQASLRPSRAAAAGRVNQARRLSAVGFRGCYILYHECCAVFSNGSGDLGPEGMPDDKVLDFWLHGERASGIGLRCQLCGLRGATTGCLHGPCQQFYHYPCARVRALQGHLIFARHNRSLVCHDHAELLQPPVEGKFLGMWMEGAGGWNHALQAHANADWLPHYGARMRAFEAQWHGLMGMPRRPRGGEDSDPEFSLKRRNKRSSGGGGGGGGGSARQPQRTGSGGAALAGAVRQQRSGSVGGAPGGGGGGGGGGGRVSVGPGTRPPTSQQSRPPAGLGAQAELAALQQLLQPFVGAPPAPLPAQVPAPPLPGLAGVAARAGLTLVPRRSQDGGGLPPPGGAADAAPPALADALTAAAAALAAASAAANAAAEGGRPLDAASPAQDASSADSAPASGQPGRRAGAGAAAAADAPLRGHDFASLAAAVAAAVGGTRGFAAPRGGAPATLEFGGAAAPGGGGGSGGAPRAAAGAQQAESSALSDGGASFNGSGRAGAADSRGAAPLKRKQQQEPQQQPQQQQQQQQQGRPRRYLDVNAYAHTGVKLITLDPPGRAAAAPAGGGGGGGAGGAPGAAAAAPAGGGGGGGAPAIQGWPPSRGGDTMSWLQARAQAQQLHEGDGGGGGILPAPRAGGDGAPPRGAAPSGGGGDPAALTGVVTRLQGHEAGSAVAAVADAAAAAQAAAAAAATGQGGGGAALGPRESSTQVPPLLGRGAQGRSPRGGGGGGAKGRSPRGGNGGGGRGGQREGLGDLLQQLAGGGAAPRPAAAQRRAAPPGPPPGPRPPTPRRRAPRMVEYSGCVAAPPPVAPGELRVAGVTVSPTVVAAYISHEAAAAAHTLQPVGAPRGGSGAARPAGALPRGAPAASHATAAAADVQWSIVLPQDALKQLERCGVHPQALASQLYELLQQSNVANGHAVSASTAGAAASGGYAGMPQDLPVRYVQCRHVPQSDPRAALRGGFTLEAIQDLEPGTILGPWRSYAMSAAEFTALSLDVPRDWDAPPGVPRQSAWMELLHRYTLLVRVPALQGGNPYASALKPGAAAPQLHFCALGRGNLCAHINDPATDPAAPGGGGGAPANAEVVVVLVNGLPLPLLVAGRAVRAGEELGMSFGPRYWDVWRRVTADMRTARDGGAGALLPL
ncbi:hypothetical protein HT031_003620 [Scenedesmus sp. PABB004]|nr:hypothetical protein HT031_003620 [Scenedesmus sp. PABB004]